DPFVSLLSRLSELRAVAEVRQWQRAPRQAGGRRAARSYPRAIVGMSAKGRPYVAVVGAASASPAEPALAEEIGRRLAEPGAVLVCGGLGGVMEAASRGCEAAGGTTLGILPGGDRGDAN